MKSFLVVTITCPDRPAIVERVTDMVVAHGGNWEESRLARLGGDFAGIVMVSVPPITRAAAPSSHEWWHQSGHSATLAARLTQRDGPSPESRQ